MFLLHKKACTMTILYPHSTLLTPRKDHPQKDKLLFCQPHLAGFLHEQRHERFAFVGDAVVENGVL